MEEIMTTLTGTKYPKARRGTDRTSYPYQLLKHPKPDNKIGRKVTRGEFKGYRIYSLTLEERATCPASCLRWNDCYGNNMPFAHRLRHGLELEARLVGEVFELCHRYPDGVMIRLHVLGDFYSEPYVHIWDMLLGRFPNLAVWGYTHRDPNTDPIGAAILETRERHGMRFAIRQSDNPFCHFSADHESIAGGASITCPEQEGKTDNCGTCALCWSDVPHIRFLHH
jgi:hypothetical protein